MSKPYTVDDAIKDIIRILLVGVVAVAVVFSIWLARSL